MCIVEVYLRGDIESTIWDMEVANNEDETGGHGSSGRSSGNVSLPGENGELDNLSSQLYSIRAILMILY